MHRHLEMHGCILSTITTDALVLNTLRLRQNGHHFLDDILKLIFLNENIWISLKISLKLVPKLWINIPALVQIMAWHQPGDKPLSEPMMFNLRDKDRFWRGLLSQCTRARAKQEVKSRGRMPSGFDVLFAQARVHCDNKPRQIGFNHDYNMTFSIWPCEC